MTKPPATSKLKPSPLEMYDRVVEQILREEANVANRIQWLLTFSGLLFVALGFDQGAVFDQSGLSKLFWIGLPLLGLAITASAFAGIVAANQSKNKYRDWWGDRLKELEKCNELKGARLEGWFPLPYGPKEKDWKKNSSFLGRLSSYGVCAVLASAWIAVGIGIVAG